MFQGRAKIPPPAGLLAALVVGLALGGAIPLLPDPDYRLPDVARVSTRNVALSFSPIRAFVKYMPSPLARIVTRASLAGVHAPFWSSAARRARTSATKGWSA